MKGKNMVKMVKQCDNKSVGLIVQDSDGRVLLIKRAKFPFGFACPAGHVDDHGGWEEAAKNELEEEVGLAAKTLTLIYKGTRDNPCRRPGGTHHYWKVYLTDVEDFSVDPSEDETKGFVWADAALIEQLSDRTRLYQAGNLNQAEWDDNPGLEPIWDDFLKESGFIS